MATTTKNSNKYFLIKNGVIIYKGSHTVARNKFNHAVAEDFRNEDEIYIVDEQGNIEEEHNTQ